MEVFQFHQPNQRHAPCCPRPSTACARPRLYTSGLFHLLFLPLALPDILEANAVHFVIPANDTHHLIANHCLHSTHPQAGYAFALPDFCRFLCCSPCPIFLKRMLSALQATSITKHCLRRPHHKQAMLLFRLAFAAFFLLLALPDFPEENAFCFASHVIAKHCLRPSHPHARYAFVPFGFCLLSYLLPMNRTLSASYTPTDVALAVPPILKHRVCRSP